MILSSFDRNELIILDRDAAGGVRELDRQLFGLTMDEIYEWLMGTRPESPVITTMLEQEDPAADVLIYQSSETNEAEAKEQLEHRQEMLRRLQATSRDH
jgi:hypothetical protein